MLGIIVGTADTKFKKLGSMLFRSSQAEKQRQVKASVLGAMTEVRRGCQRGSAERINPVWREEWKSRIMKSRLLGQRWCLSLKFTKK